MAVLTICNHKGGTGKTTSAIHTAAALGLAGYRTLIVDLDPQGFLTRTLGVTEPQEEASSLALFGHSVSMRDLPVLGMSGFDLLPSSTALTRAMRNLNKPTDVFWIKETLQTGHEYDYVLLDTAAAITVYSLNALVACQYVLIPVVPEYQPILGAEQTFQTCEMVRSKLNPDIRDSFFLLTRVDGRKKSHAVYRQYLRRRYGSHVMESIIRTSTSLSETRNDGTTVFDSQVNSRGALDYANATDEILGRVARASKPAIVSEAAPLIHND